MRALGLYAAQVGAAIRASFAHRGAFLLQVGGMSLNNLVFLTLWYLFFAGFRSVGGWRLADMALLMGLIMSIVGWAGVAFGGYRDLAATVLKGELDALLTQPKALIPRLLARESNPAHWGDVLGGALVLAGFARLTPAEMPRLGVAFAAGLTVFVSAGVAFASLAFWTAGARSFARDLTDFMLLFSSYPTSVFQGPTKLIAYTVLPAGFVVAAPVGLVRHPSWTSLAIVAGSAALYAALAGVLFHLGVGRYRRGLTATGLA